MGAAQEALGANPFTVRAYLNASDNADQLTSSIFDLWQEGKLKSVPGFGQAMCSYLDEYFKTGKIEHFQKMKRDLPKGMFEILGLPHVGSKTAFKLARHLKLRDGKAMVDLEKAARQGKIGVIEGFGAQSEKEILEGIIKNKDKKDSRMLLSQAFGLVNPILEYLKKSDSVIRADALGSLRRFAATVGDVDVAAAVKDKKSVIQYFLKYTEVKEVLWAGDNKATVVLKIGQQVDLMVESLDSYGALLQHFTGSKNHNVQLREFALKKGLSLSEHGIKNLKTGKTTKFASEASFYEYLSLEFVAPELREGQGEIEAAAKDQLPELVRLEDIRGDLQSHTLWSDGKEKAEEMARAAQEKGYEYLGLTDHQLSFENLGKEKLLSVIRERKKIIDQINCSLKNFRVLNGIEIIIKVNGDLAYPDEILREFDFVIASVHTGFNLSKQVNTLRIIKSLKNPNVTFLGHPTGRLINVRDPFEADWVEVFKVCAGEGKFLEINSAPERLDLSELLIKQAKSMGNRFIINTDAHHHGHFENMVYGVGQARRGWLSKKEIVNTLPFDKLVRELRIK